MFGQTRVDLSHHFVRREVSNEGTVRRIGLQLFPVLHELVSHPPANPRSWPVLRGIRYARCFRLVILSQTVGFTRHDAGCLSFLIYITPQHRGPLIGWPLDQEMMMDAKSDSPQCKDCGIAAVFRTTVPDICSGRRARVYQCQNCAKVIWEEDKASPEATHDAL